MIPSGIYEGDGLLRGPVRMRKRGEPATRECAAVARNKAETPRADSNPPPRRELSERRSEAMRQFFPKLFAWFADRLQMAQMREVERYLAAATDVFDLEERIRRVQRIRRSDLN